VGRIPFQPQLHRVLLGLGHDRRRDAFDHDRVVVDAETRSAAIDGLPLGTAAVRDVGPGVNGAQQKLAQRRRHPPLAPQGTGDAALVKGVPDLPERRAGERHVKDRPDVRGGFRVEDQARLVSISPGVPVWGASTGERLAGKDAGVASAHRPLEDLLAFQFGDKTLRVAQKRPGCRPLEIFGHELERRPGGLNAVDDDSGIDLAAA
jgi:hypothetical protein